MYAPDSESHCRPKVHPKFSDRRAIMVASGPDSAWVIGESGAVWGSGNNASGQVDTHCKSDTVNSPHVPEVLEDSGNKVVSVSSGSDHTACILDSGALLVWGSNEFGQAGLKETNLRLNPRTLRLPVRVAATSCGATHSLMLDVHGQVWSFGHSSYGALGLNKPHRNTSDSNNTQPTEQSIIEFSEPKRIPALLGLPCVQVSAGNDHSMTVTASGELFAWGRSLEGQLGLGQSICQRKKLGYPMLVDELKDFGNVKRVSCGMDHSVVLMSKSVVLSTGSNAFGQLGCTKKNLTNTSARDATTNLSGTLSKGADILTEFAVIKNVRGVFASCGEQFTAIVDSTGRVLTFGRNDSGQLGRANSPFAGESPSDTQNRVYDHHPLSIDATEYETETGKRLAYFSVSCGRAFVSALAVCIPSALSNLPGTIMQPSASMNMQFTEPLSPFQPFVRALSRESHPAALARSVTNNAAHHLLRANSSLQQDANDSVSRLDSFQSIVYDHVPAILRHGSLSVNSIHAKHSHHNSSFTSNQAFKFAATSRRARPEIVEPLPVSELASLVRDMHNIDATTGANAEARLQSRLSSIFLSAASLNQSFTFSGKRHILDLEGLVEAVENIPYALHSFIFKSFAQMLEDEELSLNAQLLTHPLQIRFLILLLCWPVKFSDLTAAANTINAANSANGVSSPPRNAENLVIEPPLFLRRLVLLVLSLSENGRSMLRDALVKQCGPASLSRAAANIRAVASFAFRRPMADCDSVNAQVVFFKSMQRSSPLYWGAVRMLCLLRTSANMMLDSKPSLIKMLRGRPIIELSSFHLEYQNSQPAPDYIEILKATEGRTQEIASICLAESGIRTWRPESNFLDTNLIAHLVACPPAYKRDWVRAEAEIDLQSTAIRSAIAHHSPVFTLVIDREHIVSSALRGVQRADAEELNKPLKIQFKGEDGIDQGGVAREFFSLFFQRIMEDETLGMFTYLPDVRMRWISPCLFALGDAEMKEILTDVTAEYRLVGVLMALAVHNSVLLNLNLPRRFFDLLITPDLDVFKPQDFEELFPTEARSYQSLLDHPEDDKEGFDTAFGCLTFSATEHFFGQLKEVSIVEDGINKAVTMNNREDFISHIIRYKLLDSVRPAVQALREGFSCVKGSRLMRFCDPDDLLVMICGNCLLSAVDLLELEAGCQYIGGFDPSQNYVKAFWHWLHNLNMEKKRQFLKFCTGGDRAPAEGWKALGFKLQRNGRGGQRIPSARTCFNLLLLPEYDSVELMEKLLDKAIAESEGFGME